MSYRIVHAADLHIDSPLRGLTRYEGAPVAEVRGATRRALTNLVDLCLEERAALLLLSGDLYDGEWRDYATGLFFAKELARLREVGTEVVWIRGNHDAQSRLTKHLELGPHVRELGAKRPESAIFEQLGVAVHGQGFATAAVTEDLSAGYPARIAGLLNVGLLHTALSGRIGHAPYAPCDVSALVHKGYDYWALGHVHAREVVHEDPWIVFPGNLQGRHVRETGEKGATLLTVDDTRIRKVEHRALDVVRFHHARIDASHAHTGADVVDLCRRAMMDAATSSAGRLAALRISVAGRSRAHSELAREPERIRAAIQARANELSVGDVWVERVRFETELALDLDALSQRNDAIGQVVRSLSRLHEDGEVFEQARELLIGIERALPAELRSDDVGLDLDDADEVRSLLASVEQLILPRLLESS